MKPSPRSMAKHFNSRKDPAAQLLSQFLLFLICLEVLIPAAFVKAASNVHIVYMGKKQHEDPTVVEKSHRDMLTTLLGSKEAVDSSMLYSYKHGFSGFAAILTQSQAETIANVPGVIRVIPNRIHKLHTTRSWDFLGLHLDSSPLVGSKMGEGMIVGVIDTGVWPESESFNDEGMGPIPSRWNGLCRHGQSFNSTNCNKKLIGAKWFIRGALEELHNSINVSNYGEFLSARDADGHGTHTSSTVAGNFVKNANYRGLATGVAKGGVPHAHLAIYKSCWKFDMCATADLVGAFDEAIHDGVDVLSLSIATEVLPLFPYIEDGVAIGSFHAVAKGITVVCAGGNAGPNSQTVANTAPWIINVGASTIDRAFTTAITLGSNQTFLAQSLDTVKHNVGFSELVLPEDIAQVNRTDENGSSEENIVGLDSKRVKEKVILFFSVKHGLSCNQAGSLALAAGASAVILAQPPDNLLEPCGFFPRIRVDYEIGTEILSYIRRTRYPVVKLGHPKTLVGKFTAPRVADFSSRGPSSLSPAVLKPDIVAPGVNILAAVPPGMNNDGYGFMSGTSMACPHVSAIATIIKSIHKDWSPAAIKSALVTTASQSGTDGGIIAAEGSSSKPANPFDMGGGHVNPNRAMHPGLVYDISITDYVHFLCSMGYNNSAISNLTDQPTSCKKNSRSILDMNLPSILISNLNRTVTISRTVTNVGPVNSTYKSLVQSPPGVKMTVKPQILLFNSSITKRQFRVTFFSSRKMGGDYSFGSLTWTDGAHYVRSPVAVRVMQLGSFVEL